MLLLCETCYVKIPLLCKTTCYVKIWLLCKSEKNVLCKKKRSAITFQRPRGSFDILFIQLVSKVTKTNQDSPRSKMGRSFRIWSPFCHPSKTELKCAFFSFFRKKQNFLKKGAFKAKITARDMMWLCYKFYHYKIWNVSFH